MIKEITTSLLAVLIVSGTIVSLFFPELSEVGSKTLFTLSGLVIGYYFGTKSVPFGGVLGKKK